jgi:homogentisate 1,2-dioxygenase
VIDWEGPLRPRAFDLNKIGAAQASPWDAPCFLSNANVKLRFWRVPSRMETLARNGDGDELIFVHEGAGDLYCDYGHLAIRAGDYIMLPRGTMWRIDCSAPMTALLIEATNGSYSLPEKGWSVRTRSSIRRCWTCRPSTRPSWRNRVPVYGACRSSAETHLHRHLPVQPLGCRGLEGRLAPVRINVKDIRPLMSHRYHLPPRPTTTLSATASSSAPSARGRSNPALMR